MKEKKSKKVDKTPSKVKTTKELMMARKKELQSRGGGGGIFFPKDGVTRMRILSQGDDKELGMEVTIFYLNKQSIISPKTFDEPCPIFDKYLELKSSDDDDDKELAKLLIPKRRYIIGATIYKDERGKEIDKENIGVPVQVPASVYNDIIDYFLDEDDWGDMTDIKEGYDIKITRSGKGMKDTQYSVSPCPGKKDIGKEYRPKMDLEQVMRKRVKSYDELEDILKKFLNGDTEDEDEEKPKKKKKKSSKDI